MTELNCKILDVSDGFVYPNITYGVFDGEELISSGVSSSVSFVKSDASDYHTKEKFNKLYPNGWRVNFNF